MNNNSAKPARSQLNPWRMLGWGTIAGLIALPAIAMQFTSKVNWTGEDFVFAILMLGGVGLAFEMAVRASGSWAYRGGVAVALGAGLVMLWINAAVGIVGNEDRLINLWFNLIPLLALFGAIGARFKARGMAAAMFATAAAQMMVGVIIHLQGEFAWVFVLVWTAGWLLSAWLFRKAVRQTEAS
ncbi:hypothetical protein [Allopontixanthobacter sediminis]|uniref:Uncharacterized protein n=1 Tax=Allopontixanthobacter sediminis TaxID=1689985 RepID=A0A845AVN2_9SPHN|nr:hypothetical protein [Allopontixanthobacter sediminis]MXP43071.1 hypothetical protein [Allopontixanthobacter sediminis]